MPSTVDVAFVVFFTVIVTTLQLLYFFPRFKAALAAGVRTARRNAYRRVIIGQWALTAIGVALASRRSSPASVLRLGPTPGVHLIIAILIIVVTAVLAAVQSISVVRATEQQREVLRPQIASVEFLLPRTRTELRWFMALSVTAGVCEELLYRGYLLWALRPLVGLTVAIILGILLFGAGHLYQGWRGFAKTATVGAVMTGIVFASGWIVPAMIVHALVDASAGIVGFVMLVDRGGAIGITTEQWNDGTAELPREVEKRHGK